MTLIWTDPPDSARPRWMKSATGGSSDALDGVPAIRNTTGPPAGPPALSAPAVALQPGATAAPRARAGRGPAFVIFMSGSRPGDGQLEDGPVPRPGEHLPLR